MAVLSFANASTLHSKAIDVLEDLENALVSNNPCLDDNADTLEAANLGENQVALAAAIQGYRGAAASLLTPAAVRAFLLPVLQDWCVTIGAPEGKNADYDTAIWRIREYFVANSKSVNSRGMTYGATSSVTGTGTGTIRQLTVDDEGFNLEAGHAETKTFTCIADQSNVEKHHEVFQAKGAVPFRDALDVTGSGIVSQLVCATTRNSAKYISNPSFNQYGGTTAPSAGSEQTITAVTSITGWTADSTTSCKISLGPSDASYRDLVGEPSASRLCVKFEDNRYIQQQLNENQNPLFRVKRPVFLQVAVYRGSSCDGTLTITFGATTRAVTMSTLSDGAWNVVTLTLNKGLYPRNFRSNNALLKFALASRTTGHLYLDDIVMEEMTFIDGTYWIAVGGATPFVYGDYMTAAYSDGTRAKRSYWTFFRAGVGQNPDAPHSGFCWPTNDSAAETEADP